MFRIVLRRCVCLSQFVFAWCCVRLALCCVALQCIASLWFVWITVRLFCFEVIVFFCYALFCVAALCVSPCVAFALFCDHVVLCSCVFHCYVLC